MGPSLPSDCLSPEPVAHDEGSTYRRPLTVQSAGSSSKSYCLAIDLANRLDVWVPTTGRLVSGDKLMVPITNIVGRRMFLTDTYEAEVIHLVNGALSPGDVHVAVGAHVGQYTVLASRLVGPTGTIVSVGPNPKTRAWLRDNFTTNTISNAIVIDKAPYSKNATMQFHLGHSRNIVVTSRISKPKTAFSPTISVEAMTLDSLLADLAFPNVTLIKADIEGAELEMLKSSRSLLEGSLRPVFILEYNERSEASGSPRETITVFLTRYHYKIFSITPNRLIAISQQNPDYPRFNVIAFPEELLSRFSSLVADST